MHNWFQSQTYVKRYKREKQIDLPDSSVLWVQSVIRSPRRARARAGDIANSAFSITVINYTSEWRLWDARMLWCPFSSSICTLDSYEDVVSLFRGWLDSELPNICRKRRWKVFGHNILVHHAVRFKSCFRKTSFCALEDTFISEWYALKLSIIKMICVLHNVLYKLEGPFMINLNLSLIYTRNLETLDAY